MEPMTSRLALVMALSAGCAPEYEVQGFVGGDGELRFNLTFTNEDAVDLDLHVVTPGGEEISYQADTDSTGGALDVDCYCGSCEQGPNENIFWEYGGDAAPGDYTISVEYFGPCGAGSYDDYDYYSYYEAPDPEPSDYTLRLMEAGQVLETFTGTLATVDDEASYTHVYAADR